MFSLTPKNECNKNVTIKTHLISTAYTILKFDITLKIKQKIKYFEVFVMF